MPVRRSPARYPPIDHDLAETASTIRLNAVHDHAEIASTISLKCRPRWAEIRTQDTALAIQQGAREGSVIFLVVGLAVMREGSETVLFLYGLASGDADGLRTTLIGAVVGVGAGALVGALLYLGLLRIPLRWFFSVTAALVLLLAASMASQVARSLVQANIIPSLGSPVWDSSSFSSQSSPMGTLLHGLVGYDARPAGVQLVFYLVALLGIGCAMVWVGRRQPQKSASRR